MRRTLISFCLIIFSLNVLWHRPFMTSVYEWHCSHACTSTLVMGRTLDLSSVIELARRSKFLFIYSFNIYIFWGRFDFHFEADLTGNRRNDYGRNGTMDHRGSQLYFHITRYVLKRRREDSFWGVTGLPLLWNQREKWLLFQVLTKEKWETTGRNGESQNIFPIVPLFTFTGHYHGIRML